MAHPIRLAFLLSGIAGLIYEVLWSRYLGLFVGHGAYAQVLVLAVYLGGMAVGSFAVSDVSRKLRRPLLWYAAAEVALGVFGFGFHLLYMFATDVSYDVLFPAIGSGPWVGSVRWAVAGVLILPQAIVLGTTFPLMAAGLVRIDAEHPGGRVADAYLLNSLGGAAGVLLAGFVLIGAVGLPGTSIAAGLLNGAAATLVWWAVRSAGQGPGLPAEGRSAAGDAAIDGGGPPTHPLEVGRAGLLLVVAFGTALASFAYEIGWIRMLSLLLGSATHSFELMLSAFILGIAVGAWLIRRRSDDTADPLRLLGMIQVLMGAAALLSLPVYLGLFDVVAAMIGSLSGRPDGYAWFNAGRYGLSLLVMLPSTVLAGMTLPLITGTLIRWGAGERVIGRVYGANTLGSVAGAGIAGLVALPVLGLKGLIVAGAALDALLGLWVLERAGRWSGRGRRVALAAAGVAGVLFAVVPSVVEFEPNTVTSGVYRRGRLEGEQWRNLFYQDGRTATVSAHIGTSDGVIVLATNGKPDASLGPRWILDRRDTLPELPIPQGRDFTTQVVAPMVALAHQPAARTVANVGHGSGMTAASFLTSRTLERLVTIEIEPLMVEGSLVFLPANGPAFADPRVSYVFDDAKSFFSYRQERYDIIFAEPSNPWVSGTASLFTREFYERVTDFMNEGGVLAQWMQLYELNDDLFLSVLAALDAVFPSYRAYLIGDSDVAIIASTSELGEPDWTVVETPAFRALTTSAPPFFAQHMEALELFDRETFRPILDGPVAANSDYHPVLDLGAERARFEQTSALGTYSFATSRVTLRPRASTRTRGAEPAPYALPPAYGLAATVLRERGAWLRGTLAAGGGMAPEAFPEWQDELVHLESFLTMASDSIAPVAGWPYWTAAFLRAEGALHWGTRGWVDPRFYGHVQGVVDGPEVPEPARAAADLMHAYALGDWPRAAAAADVLVARAALGDMWVPPDLLVDVGVVAYLETGQADLARSTLVLLGPLTGRPEGDLRRRLLEASIAQKISGRSSPPR